MRSRQIWVATVIRSLAGCVVSVALVSPNTAVAVPHLVSPARSLDHRAAIEFDASAAPQALYYLQCETSKCEQTRLYRAQLNGSSPLPLTPWADASPIWGYAVNAAGTQVVLPESRRTSKGPLVALFLIDLQSGARTRLTIPPSRNPSGVTSFDIEPTFASDGGSIYFTRTFDHSVGNPCGTFGTCSPCYPYNCPPNGSMQVSLDGSNMHKAPRPGRYVSSAGNGNVILHRADGTTKTIYKAHVYDKDQAKETPFAGPPALSPDGRHVIFGGSTYEGPSAEWVMPVGDSSRLHKVWQQPGFEDNDAPFWWTSRYVYLDVSHQKHVELVRLDLEHHMATRLFPRDRIWRWLPVVAGLPS